jgi:N6-adenosine-specific RNA methylase IME4
MNWPGLTPPYGTILADPPWTYRTTSRLPTPWTRATAHSAAAAQYTTMSMEAIRDLPVGELAAPAAHLYLWATTPLLFGDRRGGPGPVDVVEAWGFRYVTLLTWSKIGPLGMGFYFRGVTEHVLFGVRGEAKIPAADRLPNLVVARKQGHSVKPAAVRDVAERVSPGPYVELFARQQTFGWDSWGLGYEGAAS